MTKSAEKTVASISFHDNKNLSVDMENVVGITVGTPQKMGEETWFVDLIIRSEAGNVSLQLTADSVEKLLAIQQEREAA